MMRESGEAAGRGDRQSARWLRFLRKLCVAVIGGTIVALGVALIVLPGPAVLVIPAGVAVLATEFAWAERLLIRMRRLADRTLQRAKRARRADSAPFVG
jgi:tellurite resistance protein TerC